MTRALVLPALAAALALASPAAAQEPATPEALVSAYMDALKASDWERVTGYMHPDALRDFKALFTPLLTLGEDAALQELFGVDDAETFNTTSPTKIFSAFMENVVSSAGMAEAMANTEVEVIGGVPERGTDLTHVVYRMTVSVQGMTITKMDVLPARQDVGRWRAMLSGDLEGMATMLKQQMQRMGK